MKGPDLHEFFPWTAVESSIYMYVHLYLADGKIFSSVLNGTMQDKLFDETTVAEISRNCPFMCCIIHYTGSLGLRENFLYRLPHEEALRV